MNPESVLNVATEATASIMGAPLAAAVNAARNRSAMQIVYSMPDDALRYLQATTIGDTVTAGGKAAVKSGSHPAFRQAREWAFQSISSEVDKFLNSSEAHNSGRMLFVTSSASDIKRWRHRATVHFLILDNGADSFAKQSIAHALYEPGNPRSLERVFPEATGRIHTLVELRGTFEFVIFKTIGHHMSNRWCADLLNKVQARQAYNMIVLPDQVIFSHPGEDYPPNPIFSLSVVNTLWGSMTGGYNLEVLTDTIQTKLRELKDPVEVLQWSENNLAMPLHDRTRFAAAVLGLPFYRFSWVGKAGAADKCYDIVAALWRTKADPVWPSACGDWISEHQFNAGGFRVYKLDPVAVRGPTSVSYSMPSVDRFYWVLDLPNSVHQFNKSAKSEGFVLSVKPQYRAVRASMIEPTMGYLARLTEEQFDKNVVAAARAHFARENYTSSLVATTNSAFKPQRLTREDEIGTVLVMNELHHRQHITEDLEAIQAKGFGAFLARAIGKFAPGWFRKFYRWLRSYRDVDFWVWQAPELLHIEQMANGSRSLTYVRGVVDISSAKFVLTGETKGLMSPATRSVQATGNGDCLFDSLSQLLRKESPAQVRHEICDYIRDYMHMRPGYKADYVNYLRPQGVWGDYKTLVAASELYRIDLFVHSVDVGDPDKVVKRTFFGTRDRRAYHIKHFMQDGAGLHFEPMMVPLAIEGENGDMKLFTHFREMCRLSVVAGIHLLVVVGFSPGRFWAELLEEFRTLQVIGYDIAETPVKHPRLIFHDRFATVQEMANFNGRRFTLIFDHRSTSRGLSTPTHANKEFDNRLAYDIVKASQPCLISYKVSPGEDASVERPTGVPGGKLWYGAVGKDVKYVYQPYYRYNGNEIRIITNGCEAITHLRRRKLEWMNFEGDALRLADPLPAMPTVTMSPCKTCGKLGYMLECADCLSKRRVHKQTLHDNSDCPLCSAAAALGCTDGSFIAPQEHKPSIRVRVSKEEMSKWRMTTHENANLATAGLQSTLSQCLEAVKKIESIDVLANAYQMNGTPGCGKTKLLLQALKEAKRRGVQKAMVIIPMTKLVAEYQNIPGLEGFFEVKTTHKALISLAREPVEFVAYDELGAQAFQVVALAMALCGDNSTHVFVGDMNQTRLRAEEGDEFWKNLEGADHIDWAQCGVHTSVANYRNPAHVVEIANRYIAYGPPMVPRRLQSKGGIYVIEGANWRDTIRGRGYDPDRPRMHHMTFARRTWVAPTAFPDETENDAITVRASQGLTVDNAALHVSAHAAALIKLSAQVLVALTRARESLFIVVHDNDATVRAWAAAVAIDAPTLTGAGWITDYSYPEPRPERLSDEKIAVRPECDAFAGENEHRGKPTPHELWTLEHEQAKPLKGKYKVTTVRESAGQTAAPEFKVADFVSNPLGADTVPQLKSDALLTRTAMKRISEVHANKPLTVADKVEIDKRLEVYFATLKRPVSLETSVMVELERFVDQAKKKHYAARINGEAEAAHAFDGIIDYIETQMRYRPATVLASMKEQVKVQNVNKASDWSKVGQAISAFPVNYIVESSLFVRLLSAADQQTFKQAGEHVAFLKQRTSDVEYREQVTDHLQRFRAAAMRYLDGAQMDTGNTHAGWYVAEGYIKRLMVLVPELQVLFPDWKVRWDKIKETGTNIKARLEQFRLRSSTATPSGISFTYFITCVLNAFWSFTTHKTTGPTLSMIGGDDGILCASSIEKDKAGCELFSRVMNITLTSVNLFGSYAEFCGDVVIPTADGVEMAPFLRRKCLKLLTAKVNGPEHLAELQKEARQLTELIENKQHYAVGMLVASRDGQGAVEEFYRLCDAVISFGRTKTVDAYFMRSTLRLAGARL